MSVLAKTVVTFYEAPLGISSSKVTVEGSWSASNFVGHMSHKPLFQMRLHVWKQQYMSKIASVCLDWMMTKVGDTVKNVLVLKSTDATFGACLQNETFMNNIQQILNNANIYHVHTILNNYIQVKSPGP